MPLSSVHEKVRFLESNGVFINEKKTVKGPPKPTVVLLPTPTKKKGTS